MFLSSHLESKQSLSVCVVFQQPDFLLFLHLPTKYVICHNCCPQIDTVTPRLPFTTVKKDTLVFFFLSEPHQQTTVQPPGHQWTGTNQSEWLLMGLGQLPQTIRKGQKEINMDVWQWGVGGEAALACMFISAGFKAYYCLSVPKRIKV